MILLDSSVDNIRTVGSSRGPSLVFWLSSSPPSASSPTSSTFSALPPPFSPRDHRPKRSLRCAWRVEERSLFCLRSRWRSRPCDMDSITRWWACVLSQDRNERLRSIAGVPQHHRRARLALVLLDSRPLRSPRSVLLLLFCATLLTSFAGWALARNRPEQREVSSRKESCEAWEARLASCTDFL